MQLPSFPASLRFGSLGSPYIVQRHKGLLHENLLFSAQKVEQIGSECANALKSGF